MQETRNIPFSPPDISEREIEEVTNVLRSGWITTGPKTKEFERKIAKRCGTEKAVCLNSNTACAEMTLRLLGVEPGDEVIVPAYTYSASASVIEHVGAKIVMVDCAPDSFSMDLKQLEEKISGKTKVIIPVDLFGIPADYDSLYEIVERKKHLFNSSDNLIQKALNRIIIMADGAHSFGALYKNRPVGSIADFTNFSFHAVKNLTTAEGGAVTWREIPGVDNEEIYKQYMLLSLHGQSKDALSKTKSSSWEYDIKGLFYKCNMTDIQAALGLAQMKRYDSMLQKRSEIISRYENGLDSRYIGFPKHFTPDYKSSAHLFVIRLKNSDGSDFSEEQRNKMIKLLGEVGISTNVHYKPLPMFSAYQNLGFTIDAFPNAYNQYHNLITLPLHTSLNHEDVNYIVKNVNQTVKKVSSTK